MKKKIKGYVTVYISMILGVMIMLVVTVIEGARRQTVRFETECVMDAAINSIFAEYHREMVNRYGLLFIDDSYGQTGNIDKTKSHFLKYMNMNFQSSGNQYKSGDMLQIHADNADFSRISFASDDEGTVLRYQIIQYMKTKSGINLISNDKFNSFEIEDAENLFENYRARREVLDEQIDSIVKDYNVSSGEEDKIYDVSNPADSVEKSPDGGVLFYAFGDTGKLSARSVSLGQYISHRGYVNGYGLYESQDSPYSVADKIMFDQYLFDRLGFQGEEKEGSNLNYQIEYILEGKGSDIDNLEAVLKKIFYIRYAANIGYLRTDVGKQEEAYALALTSTSVIAQPELAEIVREAILLAWAYAESAKDMRILFDGNKLSPVKIAEDWNTSLDEILHFKDTLSNYHAPIAGSMDYKSYLQSFLLLTNNKKDNMRLMDIMEMDIRLTSGNGAFRMDNQIYQLTVDSNVSSQFGYGFSIKRSFSYQ